jgi:hypothetical protein
MLFENYLHLAPLGLTMIKFEFSAYIFLHFHMSKYVKIYFFLCESQIFLKSQ